MIYAENQKQYAKKVQQLVTQNLTKCQIALKKLLSQKQSAFKETSQSYFENVALAVFLFNNHKNHMERLEELGIKGLPDFDTFLSEQKYMTCVNQMIGAIYMLRNMLVDLWSEAVFLEEARVNGIQSLYEELVRSNQTLYGQEVMKQLISIKDN